jgi:hypothetical protein
LEIKHGGSMSRIKVDAIETTSGVQKYLGNAWADFAMGPSAVINASGGISSLTDAGIGLGTFTLSSAMPAANAAAWASCQTFSSNAEVPVQSGTAILSTTAYQARCGSDTTSRNDWLRGSTGILRT